MKLVAFFYKVKSLHYLSTSKNNLNMAKKQATTTKKPTVKKKVAPNRRAAQHQVTHNKCEKVCKMIEDEAISLRSALIINKLSTTAFYNWLDRDAANGERYERAREMRADRIFDEILDIADDNTKDTVKIFDKNGKPIEIEDKEWTSRAKLRVDARKWYLAKMSPKKYGDKIEVDQKSDVTVKFE